MVLTDHARPEPPAPLRRRPLPRPLRLCAARARSITERTALPDRTRFEGRATRAARVPCDDPDGLRALTDRTIGGHRSRREPRALVGRRRAAGLDAAASLRDVPGLLRGRRGACVSTGPTTRRRMVHRRAHRAMTALEIGSTGGPPTTGEARASRASTQRRCVGSPRSPRDTRCGWRRKASRRRRRRRARTPRSR